MSYRLLLVPIILMGFTVTAAYGQEEPRPKDEPQPKADAKAKAGAKAGVDDKKTEAQSGARTEAGAKIDAKADSNVRVEARGPVHEAFAQPWEKNPGPNQAVAKRPPDPLAEEPPDQRP